MEQQIETRLIPRELIFGNPEQALPQISPSGTQIAWSAPLDGVLNIWLAPVGKMEEKRAITSDHERGVPYWFWGDTEERIFYIQDRDGDENWRLYSVEIETGAITSHTPYENIQVSVVKFNLNVPDTVLLAINLDNPELKDLYRLTPSTGELTKIATNPGTVLEWIVDEEFRPRAALGQNAEGGIDLFYRDDEASDWRILFSWEGIDSTSSEVLGFNAEGTHLYMLDPRNANTARFVIYEIATGESTEILSDPTYDVTSVLFSRKTRTPLLAAVLRDRLEWELLDPSLAPHLENWKELSGGEFTIMSRDRAEEKWVILATPSDRSPASYIYNLTTETSTFLFVSRPALEEYQLAPMEPFSFTSRDGLQVHGYITFPVGLERRDLPLVLNVHGGPWTRDTWGYDPEAQWLANRGYICMQVNYRGSTGYGKDFVYAANREWGGKMHDDLVDAVSWGVEKGYADPERLGIYGGSYGGYAALVGATFTPDLFRCSIALVGPSNLVTFINSIPPYWRPMLKLMYDRIGHPVEDEEFLKSRSPLYFVDRISMPMLIAHGANDPRVKQAESEQIVAAMKENGVPHEYLLFPDEGHGFVRPENRLRFYAAAEKFLAEHLGGRSQEDEVMAEEGKEEEV